MKLNMRVKTGGIVVVLALVYWFTSAVFSGKGPQSSDYQLFAASRVEGGKAEVRLRWIMKSGWLPEAGFNLYRSEPGGKEILLNPAVLGTNAGKIAAPWKVPAEPKENEGQTKDKLNYSYQEAVQTVRANQDKLGTANFSLQPSKRLPSSLSESAFLALKKQRELLNKPAEPGLPNRRLVAPASYPELATYHDFLGRNQAVQHAEQVKTVQASPALMLRTQLVIGAMLHPDTIGADLGLAFTDTNVEEGKTYHYVLKVRDKDKETAVAHCDITVKPEPPPAAPAKFIGFQQDAATVCFRWERIASSKNHGLVSYHLHRIDDKNPEPGKRINSLPIIIWDLPIRTRPLAKQIGEDATHIEPIIFFRDTSAGSVVPGTVTYKLVAVDMFGRQSQPATTTVKIEDLLAPPAVAKVAAERSAKTGKVQIIWTALEEPNVQYNVSRIDSETNKEEALGQTQGENLPTLLPEYPNLDAMLNPAKKSPHVPKVPQTPKKGQKLEKPELWLSVTDAPPEDHYFVYKVTAVYKNHPTISAAEFSGAIPVPSLKAPTAPTIEASFVPADKLPKSMVSQVDVKKSGKSVELPFPHSPDIQSVKPADPGGAVQVTWSSVPNAHRYRIYRASGTGFRPTSSDGDTKKSIRIGQLQFQAEIPELELKEVGYSLVGQVTEKTKFYDYVPRSPAHIYWYRVVAVNRWGVPGTNATAQNWSKPVKVRVPATVMPSIPILVSAGADQAGNISLAIRRPGLLEGALTYHVYRVEVVDYKTVFKEPKEYLKDAGKLIGDEIVILDTKVEKGRTYQYHVVADNGETPPLLSDPSNRLRATTFKALVTAPASVEAVKKGSEIHLQWPGAANAAGYIVERALGGPTGLFVQISDWQTATSFVDFTPGTKGPTYTYRVIAVDSAGNISNPNDYPLNQQPKDLSKYPAQATVSVK